MYNAIIFVLIAAAILTFVSGLRKGKKSLITLGISIGVFTILFFLYIDFYGELLWYESLGYADRFWITVSYQSIFTIAGALFSALITWFLTLSITHYRKAVRPIILLIALVIGGFWGYSNWEVVIKYWYAVPAGVTEPIFGNDAGFYLFKFPFYQNLYSLFFSLVFISLIASAFTTFFRIVGDTIRFEYPGENIDQQFKPIYLNVGLLFLLLSIGKYLDRYELMYSRLGVVAGPGWTDVNVLLPGYIVVIVVTFIVALIFLIPALRRAAQQRFQRTFTRLRNLRIAFVIISFVSIFLFWFVVLTVVPGLFQWFSVQPNEITYEVPYISNNIQLTRYGFGLNNIEEKEFSVTGDLSQSTVDRNPSIFNNIRLWDWHALQSVYKQFQEIRLYYEFQDVDVDRYIYNNSYRQVMVSAREMEIDNLPRQSQTFVNRIFKYTHGFGITLASASEFTPEGLPNLLIKDIPPVSSYPNLKVDEPRIYFGEITNNHVIVNSKETEFDYPSGEENVYYSYKAKGGVELSNLWRKFVYGWKFDGSSLFFSSYPTEKAGYYSTGKFRIA